MCTGPEVAAITSLVISAGSSSYSIYSQRAARSDAEEAARKQEEEQQKALSEMEKQRAANQKEIDKKQAEIAAASQLSEQASRPKKKAMSGTGPRDTILTSPQGLRSEAPVAGKTLLGL